MHVPSLFGGCFLLAGLSLAGCGGGGGGGGTPYEYHVLSLHRDVAGDTVRSRTIRYPARVGGSLTGGEGYSSDGGGLLSQADVPFSVDAARTITATSPGGATLTGRMSEDGVFGVASTAPGGGSPDLLVVMRRDPAPTLADLVGEWLVLLWRRSPASGGGSQALCSLSEGQISPESAYQDTATPAVNDDGTVTTYGPWASFVPDVTIDANGWIGINDLTVGTLHGSISADHDVILLGGSGGNQLGAPGNAEIRVLVRRGLAIDVSETLGPVAVAGFQINGTAFASIAGSGTIAGLSGGTSSIVADVDDVWTPTLHPAIDLTVQVSGKAFLQFGALACRGATGPAGGYLGVIGGLSAGDSPGIYFFVR